MEQDEVYILRCIISASLDLLLILGSLAIHLYNSYASCEHDFPSLHYLYIIFESFE